MRRPRQAGDRGISPLLNAACNSVRAQRAIKYIAEQLGASIFLPH